MIKKIIKKVLPHQRNYYRDLFFRKVDEKKLANKLSDLGVCDGSLLYIQSSFGSLGYYPDGPKKFVKLLKEMIGEKGTIVMPSFPTNGSMEDYLQGHSKYDARHTPSRIGLLPELFRQLPGVRRSCHPTHPVAAIGYLADEIISNHENCTSPQGDGSPFDKLVQFNALILRIGTPAFPLCHRLQEIVKWPNLFLKDPKPVSCISDNGEDASVSTLIYRKKVPFVLFLPDQKNQSPVAINLIDFPTFSRMREESYKNDVKKTAVAPVLMGFREVLLRKRIFKQSEYNDCYIDSSKALEVMNFSVETARKLIDRFTNDYDLDNIKEKMESGEIEI